MENLQFPTHLLIEKYKIFYYIQLGFLCLQGGIWFLSIRARRGPTKDARCSGTESVSLSTEKAGLLQEETPAPEIGQSCPALWQEQGTRYLKFDPSLRATGETSLCMASTGGSRDISNKKVKSLFSPQNTKGRSPAG